MWNGFALKLSLKFIMSLIFHQNSEALSNPMNVTEFFAYKIVELKLIDCLDSSGVLIGYF